MSTKRLISHYAKLQHTFRHYFQLTQQSGEMENIHQLRVSIKKMRAIWSLIQRSAEGNWRKDDHLSLTTPLFKLAGRVRDAQVSLSLLRRKKSKHLVPFIEYLEAQQAAASAELVEELPAFDLVTLDQIDENLIRIMQQLADDRIIHQANTFLQEELVKVKILTAQLPDLRKLHKIRIRLKVIGEILRLLKNLRFTAEDQKLYHDVKHLNHIIGRWHDGGNLLAALYRFYDTHPKEKNPYFRQFNVHLRRKVLDQAEQLREKVQNRFSDY